MPPQFARENSRPLRVLFVIRSLTIGGAERQLVLLSRNLDATRFTVAVAPMHAGGELEAELRSDDRVDLLPLEKAGRWDVVRFGARLISLIRRWQPDVIHGYMGGANEIALTAGLTTRTPVVFGLRVSNLDLAHYRPSVRAMFRAGAIGSRLASATITNSEAGRAYHLSHGYLGRRMVVIPNGVDVHRFAPSAEQRRVLRERLGLRPDNFAVGLPARLDPMKGHDVFLRAAAELSRTNSRLRFVIVGDGEPAYRTELQGLAAQLGLTPVASWHPAVAEPVGLYSALDLVVSSSVFGEGFSNVLAEAMACGVPVVGTDVGDARLIAGNVVEIVAPADPVALAHACRRVIDRTEQERQTLGRALRERIVSQFSVQRLAERTGGVLEAVVERAPDAEVARRAAAG